MSFNLMKFKLIAKAFNVNVKNTVYCSCLSIYCTVIYLPPTKFDLCIAYNYFFSNRRFEKLNEIKFINKIFNNK